MTPSEYRDEKAEEYVSKKNVFWAAREIKNCLQDYKAGFDEGRKYTLTQDEVIQELVRIAKADWTVTLQDAQKALAKFEELKKEVSE